MKPENIFLDGLSITHGLKPGSYPGGPLGKFVRNETVFYDNEGKLLAAYIFAPQRIIDLARSVALATKPQKSSRTRAGVPQLSTVYGFLPRIPIREDYCRMSKKTLCEQENAERAYVLNEAVSCFYKDNFPGHFSHALETVRGSILPEYRLVDTPWANVNVNLNQVIKYHRDAGNIKGDLSNVLVLKNGVSGGHLVCPELGCTFEQKDGAFVFFDGTRVLHGVTPCSVVRAGGYRCSIVFYTLANMRHCYPYEQELGRVRTVKTKQAINKFENIEKLRSTLARRQG